MTVEAPAIPPLGDQIIDALKGAPAPLTLKEVIKKLPRPKGEKAPTYQTRVEAALAGEVQAGRAFSCPSGKNGEARYWDRDERGLLREKALQLAAKPAEPTKLARAVAKEVKGAEAGYVEGLLRDMAAAGSLFGHPRGLVGASRPIPPLERDKHRASVQKVVAACRKLMADADVGLEDVLATVRKLAAPPAPVLVSKARFHHHKLANGLTIIGESAPQARSVAVGFFVRTGSRDETPELCGVSHFLEHMAFKGSDKRTAEEVNRDFDRIGADYNAFTSEESTVYHAAVLPEYLPEAADIVSGLLRPVLRQDDFDMEKKVIINEIGRYEDMPHWSAYDHAKVKYFGPHDLAKSILGTPQSITDMKRDEMEAYHRRRYVASNITMVATGKFDFDEVVRLAEKYCADWPTGEAVRSGITETAGTATSHLIHKPKVAQQYVILMSPGPAAASPLRYAADLLSMAVGDDSGSRLYWELIDPGLTDSAGCSFHEYDGTGVYYTSMSCEPEKAASNVAILKRVLAEVQEKGITEDELETAKSKLLSRLVRSGERPRGRLVPVGMSWMYQGEYRSVDDDLRLYEAVTLADLRRVTEMYPLTRQTSLALGPLEKLEV